MVLNGPDGKIVVDTSFLMPAWPKFESETLDGLGNAPLKTVDIDTHWHFDPHTDNNANLHAAGATVLAHEKHQDACMAEPHDSALFGFAQYLGIAPGCFAAADIQQQPKNFRRPTVKS